jgi:hypothetical protein
MLMCILLLELSVSRKMGGTATVPLRLPSFLTIGDTITLEPLTGCDVATSQHLHELLIVV